MNELRVAVVGAGHLGRIHARNLARQPDIKLVAVVDSIPSSAQSLAAELGCSSRCDAADLVREIDAAIVAVPTQLHVAVSLPLLEAGKHVLVEKPLAPTASEGERLVDTATRRGCVLQVGHVERFNPAWLAAAPRLRDAKYIDASRTAPHRFRSLDIGVVLDLMIHDLDLVLALAGSEPREVRALGIALFGQHEDVARAQIVFENGCVADLSASRASRAARRQMQVWTPDCVADLDFAARHVSVVEPSEAIRCGQIDVERMTPAEREQFASRLFEEHLAQCDVPSQDADQISAEQADFFEAIRGGRAPRVSGTDALAVLRLADEVLASIDRHAWDGTPEGRHGPHGREGRGIIPAPHFLRRRSTEPARRRDAG